MAGLSSIALPIVAIDPGASVGWALGIRGSLVDFGTVHQNRWNGNLSKLRNALPRACVCLTEMPRVYPSPLKWKGDPQHIVRLAFLAGRIIEWYPAFLEYEPKQWQGGSLPDHILRKRTRARLTAGERRLVDSRPISAHAWDAIGILVFSLNRAI
jgi:hypothetical protein